MSVIKQVFFFLEAFYMYMRERKSISSERERVQRANLKREEEGGMYVYTA